MTGPLAGVRVLDMSRFIAGPLCCQLLGDMGAEVIKVERPAGEDARHHAPFFEGESVYTMMYNRNKFAITLNTRHERAKPLLEDLIKISDVLVENFRPGTLDAMGFSHARLREINPRLVITSISGFGQTGPYAERPLFDAIAQAMSGLMTLTGSPGGEPTMTGTFVADHTAGLTAALGTMFALFHREKTGIGQVVDIAVLDALVACLGTYPSAYRMLDEVPERRGSRDPLAGPANAFKAVDGYVYLHAGTNSLWPRLCRTMGRLDLADDPRFGTIPGRMANIEEIEAAVAAWVGELTMDEVSSALSDAGIPFGPVATIPEVVESPQLAAREMFVEVVHSKVGPVTLLGIPIKLSDSAGTIRKPPPTIGEDNEAIYEELLGLSKAELGELRSDGVI